MKTKKLLLMCLLLTGLSIQAQKIYVRAGLGAALSTSAVYLGNTDYSSNNETAEASKKGFGTGLPFVLAAGYKIHENIKIELGVNYFYGFNLKYEYTSSNAKYSYKMNAQMLSLVPAFIFNLPLEKFQPYARLGLKIGILNRLITEENAEFTGELKTFADTRDYILRDYGGIPVGVQAAIGTEIVLSDKFSFFGEIQVDGISYAPAHGKYTKYEENGADQLGNMTTKEKEVDYVTDIDYNENIPDDQPDKEIKTNYPLNNVGIVIGVKINIGQ
jgi:hypothetical protein